MPTRIAPGVYVQENDFSNYVAGTQTTPCGLVGTARKGPLNTPTICTNGSQFSSIFGMPTVNHYAVIAASNYLQYGNSLVFVRVARQYVEASATLSAELAADGTSVTVDTGHLFAEITSGNYGYVRISQPGKRTTQNVLVTNATSTTLTLASGALDTYDAGVATIARAEAANAAASAEVTLLGRRAEAVSSLVSVQAIDPGQWGNFGTSAGLEVVVEDGGQFSNIDPSTGLAYQSSGGTTLQGVMPSQPSVDTKKDLRALTGMVSGETRGVNRDSILNSVLSVSKSGSDCTAALALYGGVAHGLSVGDTFDIVGTTGTTNNITGAIVTALVAAGQYQVETATVVAAGGITANGTVTIVITSASLTTPITLTPTMTTGVQTTATLIATAIAAAINGNATLAALFTAAGVAATVVLTADTYRDHDKTLNISIANGTATGITTAATSAMTTVGYAANSRVTYSREGGATVAPETGEAATATAENVGGEHYAVTYRYNGTAWMAMGVHTKRVRVFYQGRQVEIFDNLIGYDATSPYFWETVIGTQADPVSKYITVTYVGNGEQPINSYNRTKNPNNPRYLFGQNTVVKLTDSSSASTSTLSNAAGQDGENPSASDYIGTINGSTYTGLQHFRKVEQFEISILAVPSVTDASVITELLAVCEQRHDCLGIVDPPMALSPQEVTDWHNGAGAYTGDHSAFVSNCAALFYPWVKVFEPTLQRQMWMPPTVFIPGIIARSDGLKDEWWAPAGIVRGKVNNALAVEYQITEGDVDGFYGPGNGNAVNPIMNFARDGITVWGQRTLQRTSTALDRINVRRLMFSIEKNVANASRALAFDQDDTILWGQLRSLIEPYLQQLAGRRALEAYVVTCDETTNTPQMRNNNEVGARIVVIPVKSAEKIILDFVIVPSGASVTEFVVANPS